MAIWWATSSSSSFPRWMGSQFAQAQSTVSGSSSSTIETLDISSVRLSLDSGVGLFVFIINIVLRGFVGNPLQRYGLSVVCASCAS